MFVLSEAMRPQVQWNVLDVKLVIFAHLPEVHSEYVQMVLIHSQIGLIVLFVPLGMLV